MRMIEPARIQIHPGEQVWIQTRLPDRRHIAERLVGVLGPQAALAAQRGESMEFLLDKMQGTKTNEEFLESMNV
ncbi:MAG: hypothetical protein IVW54_18885 [Candidatus Binataceae bacterium]|nr:hypothetical protein [Candidatus Binataceae bacterium]